MLDGFVGPRPLDGCSIVRPPCLRGSVGGFFALCLKAEKEPGIGRREGNQEYGKCARTTNVFVWPPPSRGRGGGPPGGPPPPPPGCPPPPPPPGGALLPPGPGCLLL